MSNNIASNDTFGDTTITEGTLINSATSKTTPVDADELGLADSAASSVLKKLTWANLKATLKAYFDTIYAIIPPAFSSWTPTISGMAIGNGTIDAKYIPNGKLIHWRVLITLGSTSSVSGAITLTLPVTSVAVPSGLMPIGEGVIRDVSTFLSIVGKSRWASTTTMALLFTDPATNALNDTSSTAPFTFATGDIFAFYGVYEAA